jgi:hypothetical protein
MLGPINRPGRERQSYDCSAGSVGAKGAGFSAVPRSLSSVQSTLRQFNRLLNPTRSLGISGDYNRFTKTDKEVGFLAWDNCCYSKSNPVFAFPGEQRKSRGTRWK